MPQTMIDLENRSRVDRGEPTLGRALEVGIWEWQSGNRDRELRLHLLFLAWYCNLKPPYLTGLDESTCPSTVLPHLFQEVFETFSAGIDDDAECLYVIGLMATLTPWLLGGDSKDWETKAETYRRRYRQLVPNGLPSSQFEGRGAFGEYFAHQLQVAGGF